MVAELGFLNHSAVIESSFSSSRAMTEAAAVGSPERRAWDATSGPRAAQRKRGQTEAAGTPAVSATGGATAPTTVAAATSIGTPPAQRRRTQDFTLRAGEPSAQIAELTDQVKSEFARIWDAIRVMGDKVDFELIDTESMDKFQKGMDHRFAKDHADVVKLIENMNIMEASRTDLEQRLGVGVAYATQFLQAAPERSAASRGVDQPVINDGAVKPVGLINQQDVGDFPVRFFVVKCKKIPGRHHAAMPRAP